MRHVAASAILALTLGFGALGPGAPPLPGATAQPAGQEPFDLLIVGGRVLDGTGNPWFSADIGVRDGLIAAVGNLRGAAARRVINATDRVVTPGFIDLHSHGDGALGSDNPQLRAGPAAVAQGITTVVLNQDGRSPLPIADQRQTLEQRGIGPNALLLVGHGAVRGRVLGDDIRRPSTPQEIQRMRLLVREAMTQGAFGMSAGLEYSPGRWSTTPELVGMVEEIVPWGGVYISHQRSEGSDPMWYWPSQDPPGPPNLLDAVRETIEIGERTGATVVASHIKAKGADYWGSGHAAIQLIEAARQRGVRIYADQYYYETTGSDGSTTLIPSWAFAGRGQREALGPVLARTLADPNREAMVRRDIEHEIRRRGGPSRLLVLDYPNRDYIGRTLEQLARERGLSPVDMAIALQMEGFQDRQGGAHIRGLSLSEFDIDAFARLPWVATATDGTIALGGSGGGHPRAFGTYARKLRHFVLDRDVMTLEHAIRAGTSLPAQILGLPDRGLIRPGMRADLVVIDLENVRDRGTFFEPRQYPDGFDYVLVNGVPVVDGGELTFALPGQVITPQSLGRVPAAAEASAPAAAAQQRLALWDPASYNAEIRWTAHGIPHIKADDFGSLGFGTGYAFASLNFCMLADIMLTVNGERSRYHGPGGGNLQSDFFHRRLVDARVAEQLLEGEPGSGFTPSPDARAIVRGFADGYNRYLRETGVDRIPDPGCRGAEWVREITELDLWRRTAVGSTTMLSAIVAAQPPGTAAAGGSALGGMLPGLPALPVPGHHAEAAGNPVQQFGYDGSSGSGHPDFLALASEELVLHEGSNAWALGRDVTGGGAVLLGNPHYPWSGPNRFYRLHQTIPGVLDVTGATLLGNPVVGIGHTADIAWTHTVSTARRYTLFELQLAPDEPTAYLVDGQRRGMTPQEVRVQVRLPDGSLEERSHTFWLTDYGLVIADTTYAWTAERAYAIRTAESGLRGVDQRIAWFQATDVFQLRDVLRDYLAVGFNTIAVDRAGNAFYGDVGPVPNVTRAKIEACTTSPLARAVWTRSRNAVLDGSRSGCDWGTDDDAPVPGLFGLGQLPNLVRTDYAANMNNSYWVTNPRAPITGLSPILGEEESDIGLRARLGLLMIEERLAGADGLPGHTFTADHVKTLMFNNRHYGGELVRDELVALCRARPGASVDGRTVSLTEACNALAGWDLRVDTDSRGAALFREFANAGGLRFATPFDVRNPVHTPHTLNGEDPRVLTALGQAVDRLAGANIPLDAPLGEVQFRSCGAERVPIHGGGGGEGIFNAVTAPWSDTGGGYPRVTTGASFIMVVSFTSDGPVSHALLSYSQSTENPESPFSCDQTRLFSEKRWLDMKFSEAAILADPELRVQRLQEDATP